MTRSNLFLYLEKRRAYLTFTQKTGPYPTLRRKIFSERGHFPFGESLKTPGTQFPPSPPAASITVVRLADWMIPASPGPTVRHPLSGPLSAPDNPPGPVPAARFRKNATIIRVPGGVFTSDKARAYLAAFGRPIFSRMASGTWRSKEGGF